MKTSRIILLVALAATLAGCVTYRGVQTPLKPGEKVIFNTRERADEFRRISGNDAGHTNRIVEITRPTTLSTE